MRRAAVAALTVGLVLGTPAHADGARMDNFRPTAALDASQVLSPDDVALEQMFTAGDAMTWRAVEVRWPDGAVTWIETPS